MPESKSGKDNWLIKLLKETKTTLVRGKFAIIGVTLPAMALLAALIRWGVPLKYIAPIFGIVGLIYGKLFEFYKVKRMNKEFKAELKHTLLGRELKLFAMYLESIRDAATGKNQPTIMAFSEYLRGGYQTLNSSNGIISEEDFEVFSTHYENLSKHIQQIKHQEDTIESYQQIEMICDQFIPFVNRQIFKYAN